MIIDLGGKFRSQRTEGEIARILKEEFRALSDDEKQVAQKIIQEMLLGQDTPMHQEIMSSVYRTAPVSMEQFLEDDYYLGKMGKSLFPSLKKDLIEAFSGGYALCFYGGSLGCVAQGTMIDTADGPKEVSSIKGPQLYKSWDGIKGIYTFGSEPFIKGKGRMYKIVHDFGEFVCHESHGVLTISGYIQASSLDSNLLISDNSFSKIHSIEYIGEDWYWDLVVPNTNNYSAHGCYHHNSGKTSAGNVSVIRMVYEISCLKNPQASYGITPVERISVPCISVNEDLAEANQVTKIRAMISESPYFLEKFKPIKNSNASGILFPFNVWIPPGASTEAAVLGSNPVGCFIDEGNFFTSRRSSSNEDNTSRKSNIQIIYEAMKRRIESRFKKLGKLPGLMFVGSSKRSTESFTEVEIRKNISNPHVFVSEKAIWEAQPQGTYSNQTFRVVVGSEIHKSRVLEETEEVPEGAFTIDIPIEFKQSFLDDPDQALRDHAGVSTVSISPFIARKEKIKEAIDERVHPFDKVEWYMDSPIKVLWEHLCVQDKDGGWKPRYNPSAPRHIALDLSKNQDSTGISMSHVCGFTSIKREDDSITEMLPVIQFDFVLKCRAAQGGEIKYSEIRNLIYEMSKHGFFIKLVTADQYQSAAVMETLRNNGYKTKLISVEPAGGPYESLKNAFYENRIKMYRYPPLTKELYKLEKNWKNGKVDHPVNGEKDCSDTLAANVVTLTEASSYNPNSQIIVHKEISDEGVDWILDDGVIAVDVGDHREKMAEHVSKTFVMPFDMG